MIVATLLIVGVGIAARVFALGRLPGINGDEAWYGVNVQAIIAGQPAYWATPSGNPLNPLHSIPLYLLSLVFHPSLTLLRVPTVLLSIAAVAIACPLLRPSIGERSARITTLLLASSPVVIAFARLGWDPSGTPLVTLIALGLALRDRPIAAALAAAVALAVHPTNIFFLPIVAATWAPHGLRRFAMATPAGKKRALMGIAIISALGVAAVGVVLKAAAGNPATALPPLAVALRRTASPSEWFALLHGVNRMFAGVTTTTFVAGEPAPAVSTAAELVGLVVIASGFMIRPRSSPQALALLIGITMSLALFMAAAGPQALQPGFERYALFLVVPLVVFGAIGAGQLPAGLASAFTAFVPAGLLLLTALMYFAPVTADGGHAHRAFRTGNVEPKQAAVDFIRAQGGEHIAIVCDEWWSYWPVRYLASGDRRLSVSLSPDALLPPTVTRALAGEEPAGAATSVYEISFEGGEQPPASSARPAFTAVDPEGRAILHVYKRN